MFSHLPPLNSLRVFDSAARLKSFKAAALELNVTPTAVSHQIRALEERLGTLLFERKTRFILLTAEGESLARVTHQSLQQISAAIEEVSDSQSILTVSTTASFAAQWLVPNLEGFYLSHPDIQVVVKTGELVDDLQQDKRIDLAIRYGHFDADCDGATKLVTERFGMYASSEYLKNVSRLEDATLIETKWKNSNLRPITWKHFIESKKLNQKNLIIRTYDQEQHVIQAALAGQGVALVSQLLVQTPLRNKWLNEHPKGEELEGLSYYIVNKSSAESSRKVALFRQWLLTEFRNDE